MEGRNSSKGAPAKRIPCQSQLRYGHLEGIQIVLLVVSHRTALTFFLLAGCPYERASSVHWQSHQRLEVSASSRGVTTLKRTTRRTFPHDLQSTRELSLHGSSNAFRLCGLRSRRAMSLLRSIRALRADQRSWMDLSATVYETHLL